VFEHFFFDRTGGGEAPTGNLFKIKDQYKQQKEKGLGRGRNHSIQKNQETKKETKKMSRRAEAIPDFESIDQNNFAWVL